MTLPRIRLITPCLNAEATIARTLDSVRAQAYPNLEYLILDGASSDGTLAIAAGYDDIVTRVISGKDKNIADALNKGFAEPGGEIFCYINADDTLAPGALAFVGAYFAAHAEIDVLTGGCRRVFADGSEAITTPPADFLALMAMRNA